ncbi:MAG TPA: hypothetical protein VLF69_05125 [Candidatus Saccharimonadales bacterium]|nr:hypothetical protein [Candidatus Saccharimonadales bacterium]
MHARMRDQLNTEITRKQFLQYLAGAVLMVLGLENLISLLTGGKFERRIVYVNQPGANADGFGTRRFGV